MADAAIRAVGGANAPLSYLVPGTTAIRIKLIHVAYVDNGASGNWLPAVRIVSDSKHTMGLAADQGVKVTAGSDASVSFFPGVKHASGGGTVFSNLMAAQVQLSGDYAIAKGDPGTVIVWSSATYDTGSPSAFWNPATPKRLTAPVNGIYMSVMHPIWDVQGAPIADSEWATYLYHNTEVIAITTSFAKEASFPVGATHYGFPGQTHGTFALNAGDYLVVNAYDNDPNDPAGTTHWLDLRTHVGQPPLFSSWSLILVAAT